MNIALINPLMFQENLIMRNEVVSLMYLKQFLKDKGYIADIIELQMEDDKDLEKQDFSWVNRYDIIGISCYYPFNPLVLATKIKIQSENVLIFAGGKKDITCRQIEEAIKILRSNKLAFSVSLILFHPDVTIEELIFNVKEIEELDIVYEIENLYNALILIPGTKMNVTNQKKNGNTKKNKYVIFIRLAWNIKSN